MAVGPFILGGAAILGVAWFASQNQNNAASNPTGATLYNPDMNSSHRFTAYPYKMPLRGGEGSACVRYPNGKTYCFPKGNRYSIRVP